MAKTKISQFDAVASNNTDINNVNVSEGCPPSGINDALRSLASLLKKQEVGTDAMTSPDINGGTIDGATIGASSASTGAFTNLTASGTLNVTGETTLATHLNMGDNDIIKLGASDDLQIYHTGSASIIKDGGTGDLYIAGSTNVKITNGDINEDMAVFTHNGAVTLNYDNSPKFATTSTGIDVTGTVTAGAVAVEGASGAQITITDNSPSTVSLYMGAGNSSVSIGSTTSDPLTFLTANTERMRITAGGNVSIGSSNPQGKLSVSNGTIFVGSEANTTQTNNLLNGYGYRIGSTIYGSVSVRSSYSNGNNQASLEFYTAGSDGSNERMRIDSSGRVAIGTTTNTVYYNSTSTYNSSLALKTNTSNEVADIVITNGNNNFGSTIDFARTNTSSNDVRFASLGGFPDSNTAGSESGNIRFSTKDTGDSNIVERMRIKSDGTLLYGDPTATPIGSFCDFVFTDNQAKAVFTIKHAGATATNQYGVFMDLSNDPNDTTRYFMLFRGGTTERARIQSNGDMANVNNSFGALSDEKLKEQIVDASSQWDDIKALRVRKYKLKQDVANGDSDEHWRLGVVAQEVEASGMGGLVSSTTDTSKDEEGRIIELDTTTKQVKYSVLYMKAVKALQEAITRIETLETANTALEARIVALENA